MNIDENPRSREEINAEATERKRMERQMIDRKNNDFGMCFVGAWTTIVYLDSDSITYLAELKRKKEIPEQVGLNYRVKIVSINETDSGKTVMVTSNRKAGKKKDGSWLIALPIESMGCYYELQDKLAEFYKVDKSHFSEYERPLPDGTPITTEKPEKTVIETIEEEIKPTEPAPTEPTPPEPAPEPVKPTKIQLLVSLNRDNAEGMILPVVGDIGQFIIVAIQPSGTVRLEKSSEHTVWEWVREPGEPGVPEPAKPIEPTEALPTITEIERPWQLVETTEVERIRAEKLNKKKAVLMKLRKIYKTLKDNFVWYNMLDEDVFMSIWLIPNSSLVLKGVPGTGKTQLIEMAVQLFANDIWVDGVNQKTLKGVNALDKKENLTVWLGERGVLALVKHNADKEIQDVFFYTKIQIEKFKNKDRVTEPFQNPPDHEYEYPGFDEETTFGNPPRNPPQGDFKDLMTKDPSGMDVYDIKPEPRPIVKSMIRFHNEANRMNANVADVLLGMMSEGEVEYLGTSFNTPWAWDNAKQELIPHRKGAGISFFDYNPHLEVENPNMELERALLDRITAGFYLSGGSTAMRFDVMDKRTKGIAQPSQEVFRKIAEREVEPITRKELEEIWHDLNGKDPVLMVDAEVVSWVAWMTNLPNLTNRQYSGAYDKNMGLFGKPIDRTLTTFKSALEALDPIVSTMGRLDDVEAGGLQQAVDELNRPLGVRSAQALLSLYRSYKLLNFYKERFTNPINAVAYVKTPNDREKVFDELCDLLPYVLDHRINLGVGDTIKSSFLSTFDFIKFYIVPNMKAKKNLLFAMMDAMMKVYVWNQKLSREGKEVLTEREKNNLYNGTLEDNLRSVVWKPLGQDERTGMTMDEFKEVRDKDSFLFTLNDLLTAM